MKNIRLFKSNCWYTDVRHHHINTRKYFVCSLFFISIVVQVCFCSIFICRFGSEQNSHTGEPFKLFLDAHPKKSTKTTSFHRNEGSTNIVSCIPHFVYIVLDMDYHTVCDLLATNRITIGFAVSVSSCRRAHV